MRTRSYIVTIRDGLSSRAVTDHRGVYLGAVNELPSGRFEALAVHEAPEEEFTFGSQAEAEFYLLGVQLGRQTKVALAGVNHG